MGKSSKNTGKNRGRDGDRREELKRRCSAYVKLMRKLSGYSQEEAARRAGLSRAQWIRIEQGRVLPRASNIATIADAIHLQPVALYTRAGYSVPEDEQRFDLQAASRELLYALERADTQAGFILNMQIVWQNYQAEYLKKKQRTKADLKSAEVYAIVLEHLTVGQQMELALAILEQHEDLKPVKWPAPAS